MADYNGDLKLLHHKIDAQTKKIDKIDEKMDPVCDMVARHDERIKTTEGEIDKLRKRSNIIDTVEGLAAGLAIYLGVSK